jgi:mRNA-degrading endonuclease RelE of RelBE toxin-antitoxin system
MIIKLTAKADKQLRKLPKNIQEKTKKAFINLSEDPHHPALNSKKMINFAYFEARIDYHYRFIYVVDKTIVWVIAIGMHDSGLGKK